MRETGLVEGTGSRLHPRGLIGSVQALAQWLFGFLTVVVLGYLSYSHVTRWVLVAQLFYVVPLVAVARQRGGIAFGVGVMCGAAAVLAVGLLVSLFLALFEDV
jgi:hypothetical protein